MMTSKHNIFTSDPEFCPDCGTILPVPGVEDLVVCKKCGYSVPVEAFFGIERIATTVFNKPKTKTELKRDRETVATVPSGPKIDRKCKECGHEGMTYTTQQTRGADEGQTVFYYCLKCRKTEIENS